MAHSWQGELNAPFSIIRSGVDLLGVVMNPASYGYSAVGSSPNLTSNISDHGSFMSNDGRRAPLASKLIQSYSRAFL